MKMSLFKALIMVAGILTTTAYGQDFGTSFNYLGGGARSEGMGQAYLAISDDGTAASWNPAGLHVQEKTLMALSYSVYQPKGNFGYDNAGEFEYLSHDANLHGLNYWHIVSPVRVKGHHFVLDFGYTRNFDLNAMYADSVFKNPNGPEPNYILRRSGYVSSINLGFGTRIYKGLSFGAVGNIYSGQAVGNQDFDFADSLWTNLGGMLHYESHWKNIDSISFSGFNTTFGFLYDWGNIKTAFTVRTPFKLVTEVDNTIYQHSTRNGLPNEAAPNIEGFEVFKSDTIYVDNQIYKFEMPLTLSFGLGYDIKENWLVAADLEYNKFDDRKIEALASRVLTSDGEFIDSFVTIDPGWNNTLQFRLGTEYQLNTSFGMIPFRLGFRNEQLPLGDLAAIRLNDMEIGLIGIVDELEDIIPSANKVTKGYSISFGTGLHLTNILLDFAYTYSKYEQDIYEDVDYIASKNEWKNHHLNFTFTGYF